jgi:lysophospholipase L1-like esterase
MIRIIGPLLVTVVLLLGIEGGLRVAGIPARGGGGDATLLDILPMFQPSTGPDGVPLMLRHDQKGVAFRQEKPANGFRVFVLGDSSVIGFPFGPEFAFPRFLQERLAAAMPERTVEVVNCGLNAAASWHGREILDDIVRYQPDVIIVYIGNGDWITPGPETTSPALKLLSNLHIYQLAALAGRRWRPPEKGKIDAERVHSRADGFRLARERARGKETLTAREREWILTRYADNLRAIAATGRTAGATVILSDLVQNLSDFPPGASRHRRGLSDAERAQWREAMVQADARMRAQDYRGALDGIATAERIDQRPAILHYMRAKCLEALGDYDAAREEYLVASDLDEAPLGAPSAANGVIRDVAKETGVQFVDLAGALAATTPHGMLGDGLFYDYVHPTLAGHARIATVFAAALGAPDGDGRAPDVNAIAAAHPEVQDWIYRANALVFIMLGWYDRALAEVDEAAGHYPQLRPLRGVVEDVRKQDTVRSWDDFPEAAD